MCSIALTICGCMEMFHNKPFILLALWTSTEEYYIVGELHKCSHENMCLPHFDPKCYKKYGRKSYMALLGSYMLDQYTSRPREILAFQNAISPNPPVKSQR